MKCTVCGGKTDAFLCTDCGHHLAKAIGDLPSLLDALVDRATGRTRVYRASQLTPWQDDELAGLEAEHAATQALIPAALRERAGRITLPATALPVDLDATRLHAEARNTITTWARHLSETRGIGWPTDAGACSWLLANVQAIRYDEAAREIHADLTALHAKIARAVDRSPADTYAGPCAHCGVDMWRRAGRDDIVCDARYYVDGPYGLATVKGCGMTYTLEERRRWLATSIAEALVTIDEILDALPDLFPMLPRPPKTVAQAWVRQGRLTARGLRRNGVETYSGREIIDLIVAYRPKAYASRSKRGVA